MSAPLRISGHSGPNLAPEKILRKTGGWGLVILDYAPAWFTMKGRPASPYPLRRVVALANWLAGKECGCCNGQHREGRTAMLVLSRKKNESIVINNDITIVVVEIRGDKVRLGVEAPKEVPVHRREVYDAIKRSEQASDDSAKPADAAG